MSTDDEWRRMNNNYTVKIDDIEDLLMDIFFRLPPILVLTFKRVCKRWYSLISNPQFLLLHSLRFHSNMKHIDGLFLKPCSYWLPNYHSQFLHLFPSDHHQDFPRLDFLDPTYSVLPRTHLDPFGIGSWFMLTDSCNGLLLYQTHSTTDEIQAYFVCNPITKQYIELPKLQQHENVYYNYKPHLVFDPFVSLSYKVVKCSMHRGTVNSYCQFYVYNSVTGSWKPSTKSSINHELNGDITVLLNGVLYWNWTPTDVNHIFCFHVENETIFSLPLPQKSIRHFRKCLYFGECGGTLRLIVRWITNLNRKLTLPCSFDIFEAEQNKLPPNQYLTTDVWVVKYRVINMFGFDRITMKQPSDVHILHHYKTGSKEEDEALLVNIDGRIFSYDLSCCAYKKELIIPNSQPFFEHTDVFPYIATLFPLR